MRLDVLTQKIQASPSMSHPVQTKNLCGTTNHSGSMVLQTNSISLVMFSYVLFLIKMLFARDVDLVIMLVESVALYHHLLVIMIKM